VPTKKLFIISAVAVVLAAAACNVKNVEVHGSYHDAGIRESSNPVMTEMFNLAFKAVALPAGSVPSGHYVAVYRLSSGKAEDRWWCYLAEDWLVAKVRAAGANPVERNDLAKRLLAAEGDYLEPPPVASPGAPTAPSPYAKRGDVDVTPYRATRALAYRVVAADLWFDNFSGHRGRHGRQEPTVRVNAKVIVNLRTLDVKTGEVLWSGAASGTARKTFPLSRLVGWFGIYDWEDWDEGPYWWWWWRWDGDDDSIAAPAPADAPDLSEEEPAEGDESAEEPAPDESVEEPAPDESALWPW
jgi:hypothetical protein